MTIKEFSNCTIFQDADLSYRVMSANNICLHTTTSIVSAFRYAEWFAA